MDRYDRQVRIWGSVGQKSLDRAHVCLVARSFHDELLQEVLKSLTLAGVGELTLALQDPGSDSDGCGPGSGFFPNSSELFLCGSPRVHVSSWEGLYGPHKHYEILVAVNLGVGNEIEWLVTRTTEPLLIAMAMENFGLVHLALREDHFVMDSRPEYPVPDLRIRDAWPELKRFYDSFDLDQWTSCGRLWEIPYPVILYHVIREVEGEDFANLSAGCVRRRIDQRFSNNLDDPNIVEARRFAHLALKSGITRHRNIQDLLEGSRDSLNRREWFDPLNGEISYFLKCLEVFVSRYKSLPVSGDLPDMESSSELYSNLKRLYEAKFGEDVQSFDTIMSEEEGRPRLHPEAPESFLKRLDRVGVIHPDCQEKSQTLTSIQRALEKRGNSSLVSPESSLGPLSKLRKFHNSCLIGGVASQEIIKLITHQHIPIVEPYVYRHES